MEKPEVKVEKPEAKVEKPEAEKPGAKAPKAPDEMDVVAEEVKAVEEVKVEEAQNLRADQSMDVDEKVSTSSAATPTCGIAPVAGPAGGVLGPRPGVLPVVSHPGHSGSGPPQGSGGGEDGVAQPAFMNPGTPPPKATATGTSSLNSSMSGGSNTENKVPDVVGL